jgi:hypothetical protein
MVNSLECDGSSYMLALGETYVPFQARRVKLTSANLQLVIVCLLSQSSRLF